MDGCHLPMSLATKIESSRVCKLAYVLHDVRSMTRMQIFVFRQVIAPIKDLMYSMRDSRLLWRSSLYISVGIEISTKRNQLAFCNCEYVFQTSS